MSRTNPHPGMSTKQWEEVLEKGIFTVLKVLFFLYLKVVLFLVVTFFLIGVVFHFVLAPKPAHAEDYTPLAPYDFLCIGANMTCAPPTDSVDAKGLQSVEDIVKGFVKQDDWDNHIFSQDEAYIVEVEAKAIDGIPYGVFSYLAFAGDMADQSEGMLVVRGPHGTYYCGCLDTFTGHLLKLEAGDFRGLVELIQQPPSF